MGRVMRVRGLDGHRQLVVAGFHHVVARSKVCGLGSWAVAVASAEGFVPRPYAQKNISILSKHLCPDLLAAELANLTRPTTVYLTHLKPGEEDVIVAEVRQCANRFAPQVLYRNQVIEF